MSRWEDSNVFRAYGAFFKGYSYRGRELDTLLDMIADAEHSVEDPHRYNTAMGNRPVNFVGMSINEVLQWQKDNNPPGLATAAAGRYQIIRNTLLDLKDRMGLTGRELFDQNMQDRMATELLKKRALVLIDRCVKLAS